jgi:hypothetical protein
MQGCAYRLPPISPPSHHKLQIIARDPAQYFVRVEAGKPHAVSADGRVVLEVPGVRGTCSVYFLNRIKIRGSKLNTQTLKIEREGALVRNIDLNELNRLPLDENAYHVLAIEENGRMKQGNR